MNKKFIIPITAVAMVLIVFFLGFIIDGGLDRNVAADEAILTGTVEAQAVDVASKVPGKIVNLAIAEGSEVEKGDVLFKIDTKDLEIKKAQAEAATKGAKAQLEKAIGGARKQQITQAESLVEQAEAQVKLLENKINRLYPLYEAEALPLDQLEEAETKLEVARLQAQQAHEQLDLVLEGTQAEDIFALESQHELAQAQLEEVLSLIEDAAVTAPSSGSITLVAVNEGEFVNTGMPIITMTDYRDAWVNVDIYENQFGPELKIGNTVQIKSPIYPEEEFPGEILSINKNPDFAVKKSTNELNEKDIISYRTKIKIENDQGLLFPGMGVNVYLESENQDD